jgi:hypothetical protein
VVAVAQLVESRIVIPVVVGSSPISHPKESSFQGEAVPNINRNGFCLFGIGFVAPALFSNIQVIILSVGQRFSYEGSTKNRIFRTLRCHKTR